MRHPGGRWSELGRRRLVYFTSSARRCRVWHVAGPNRRRAGRASLMSIGMSIGKRQHVVSARFHIICRLARLCGRCARRVLFGEKRNVPVWCMMFSTYAHKSEGDISTDSRLTVTRHSPGLSLEDTRRSKAARVVIWARGSSVQLAHAVGIVLRTGHLDHISVVVDVFRLFALDELLPEFGQDLVGGEEVDRLTSA